MHPAIDFAISAPLPGKQTVPRAELYACIILYESVKGPYTVYSDNQYVVQGHEAGPLKYDHTAQNHDMWTRYWDAYHQATATGPILCVNARATSKRRPTKRCTIN